MKLPIRFIGAGGAHEVHWGNSSALIEWQGSNFLIDCGFTVYPRLLQANLVDKIDAVCITHLHDDHIGSLSVLLYHRHFISRLPPLPVIVGTSELYAKLYTYLHFLMGEVELFAEVKLAEDYKPFLQALSTARLHAPHMPSCAYLFLSDEANVLYSGDIAEPLPILRDREWVAQHQPLFVFHDVSFQRSASHCYYEDLYPFLERASIWGYHCDPAQAPANNQIPLVHHTFMLA
ncbi:MAG: MBL fold metallo-hydrolase [Bacteroidia bacterium]|nr:MBL fold metallo-hydrolase [Bacteroidia bacterium]MDW8014938.1 MBL fold metallo-hydrolase [Bacteroidia bacterium]